MRGKVRRCRFSSMLDRITPAYAGKSGDAEERYFAIGDHPRLCGEKMRRFWRRFVLQGSPPPMRGKADKVGSTAEKNRITPAYAGKSGKC